MESLAQLSDTELVHLLQQKHREAEEAFHALHRRHSPDLLAFLCNRAAGEAQAQDLLQEVWLKAWRNLTGKFKGNQFRAWIFEIARHSLIDWQRKGGRSKDTALDESKTLPDEWTVLAAQEKDADWTQGRLRALQHCLQQLDRDDAEAAALVRGRSQGKPYPLLCQELRLSPEQAHRKFHEAKARLRQCIESTLAT